MNFMKIMQQAQAMQKKMAEMQERAADMLVTGVAANGMVEVVMNCKGYVQSVKINPAALDPADPTMAEDLVKAATNDARARADALLASETKGMMEGMGLPADFKLPGQ